jgi:hypothetical protein
MLYWRQEMRTMNLDMLVRAGQRPWHPVTAAEDIDVWDKYEFPICGSYRLDGRLIVFTLITTAGTRSLWAYVPIAPEAEQVVTEARFETEDEFNAFLEDCFTGEETVFAAAEDLVITSKSDGIRIPASRNALLAMGAKWYAQRSAALYTELQKRLEAATSEPADPEELLSAAQGVIETLPV